MERLGGVRGSFGKGPGKTVSPLLGGEVCSLPARDERGVPGAAFCYRELRSHVYFLLVPSKAPQNLVV